MPLALAPAHRQARKGAGARVAGLRGEGGKNEREKKKNKKKKGKLATFPGLIPRLNIKLCLKNRVVLLHLQGLKRLIWTEKKKNKPQKTHTKTPRGTPGCPELRCPCLCLITALTPSQAWAPLEAPHRLRHFRGAPEPAAPAAVSPPAGPGSCGALSWRRAELGEGSEG